MWIKTLNGQTVFINLNKVCSMYKRYSDGGYGVVLDSQDQYAVDTDTANLIAAYFETKAVPR